MSASGFVDIFFAQYDGLCVGGKSVGMGSEIAAVVADGVAFGDVFCDGKEFRHRAEWSAAKVHVQACNDDPMAS